MKPNSSLKDIRFRDWINYNTDISKALKLLIELEDIFYDIDKISLDNDQCYPEFEDFMLQIGEIRKEYTRYVDDNKFILQFTEITEHLIDVRYEKWITKDCKVSKALKLLIELEDIFSDINDFYIENGERYNEFEDFMLHVDNIRYKFVKKVESDKSLFDIK